MATVPGEFSKRESSYGRHGVRHRVQGAWGSTQDRLVVQPTSIGAEWKRDSLGRLAAEYLGAEDVKDTQLLADRLDIVWPTESFVQSLSCRTQKEAFVKENEGYLFLSSTTFNRVDETTLSRMVMYEPSHPLQCPLRPPHVKTMLRVYKGDTYPLCKKFGRADHYFPWVLLTSACLSRGAQGEHCDEVTVRFSNFELGVLFRSRLDGPRRRLYCFRPRNESSLSLVHMPIPYELEYHRYQREDASFCETPYLNEIEPGTACVGNMLLTPRGRTLSQKLR